MIILEKDIEDTFCTWVEQQGGKTWKWSGKRKKLDRIVKTHTGVIGLLELKKPGGKLRQGQIDVIQEVDDPELADWVDSLEDAKTWYNQLAERGDW